MIALPGGIASLRSPIVRGARLALRSAR